MGMRNQREREQTEHMAFPLLTAEEVGRDILGGVPAKTVNLYAREGRLPCVWVGKHRRFDRPSVERVVARAADSGHHI